MRNGVRGITVMRFAAHEGHAPRQFIAFAAPDHGLARLGGAEVIDAQIKRCLRPERP